MFIHQNNPTQPDEMFLRQTSISWHALSTVVRTDFLKLIKFSEVFYHERNYGISSEETSQLNVETSQGNLRILPYIRRFQVAITYEIDSTLYESHRIEYTYLDWIASIGGFSSILFAVSHAIGSS